LDEIKRITSAEIHTIDVSSSPENILIEAIHNADVIVTRADLAEKVKRFADAAQKTVISVGSSNDVSLLLNMLRPQ
jgi:GntR family transcriptional regulator